MKFVSQLRKRLWIDSSPNILEFWGAVIFATLFGSILGLIASLGGPIWAAIGSSTGSLAGAVSGFFLTKRASQLRNEDQLEQNQKENVLRKAKQAMNENQKRYEAAVKARKSRAGRVEQFECENLGYKGDIGCYKMRRISDDSIVLVSGHPKQSIALGDRVLVSQSSGQRLARFSSE